MYGSKYFILFNYFVNCDKSTNRCVFTGVNLKRYNYVNISIMVCLLDLVVQSLSLMTLRCLKGSFL